MQLSYQRNDTGFYWNPVTQAFDSPSEVFLNATSVNPAAGTWSATGVSTPTWVTNLGGITYNVFARAVDAAGNTTAKPGSTAFNTPYIQVVIKTPPPSSIILSPNGTNPQFRSSTVLLQGTALNATTVQVEILDCGVDLLCGNGNDDQVWNGSAFVSTGTFPTAFVGLTTFVGGAWQMNIPQLAWITNHKYVIYSQASFPGVSIEPTPQSATFVVDNTAPSGLTITPDSRLFLNSLPTLSGTASDTPPGILTSVVFRVARGDDGSKFWNWQASTFTALSGAATDLGPSSQRRHLELHDFVFPGEYRHRHMGKWPVLCGSPNHERQSGQLTGSGSYRFHF